MPDYGWVTNRLAVGGAIETLQQVRNMEADGITRILNLRMSQDEVPLIQKVGLVYCSNPSKDKDDKSKPSRWFNTSFEIVLDALAQPDQKILIHCQGGMNRAPSTMYFVLRALGINKNDSKSMILAVRPQAKGNMIWNDDAEDALKDLGFK